MPSIINIVVFWMQDMSEKKSPPQKEKTVLKTGQSDGKGMKRKIIMPSSPQEEEVSDKKGTPQKRKRGSVQLDNSPITGSGVTPRTPGSNQRPIPLSERQQMALLLKMTDESSQGADSSPKPLSPVMSGKRTPGDKRVHKRNERGETPLHLAAIKGDPKQTKKLIKAGADVNVKDFAGWTPLHEACNHGWLIIAKHLLKAGANVNVHGLENDTPLHDASANGHQKLVELLLKHGANPLQSNSRGQTPMDVAASPDTEKLLRKEISYSSSDSSSADDNRSPTSPESTSSAKEEDRAGDSEDMSPRFTGSSASKWERSCTISCSSSTRRSLLPKSPEKTASPRLFLKLIKDVPCSGESSEKSKDTETQYKAYSVTVEPGEHKDSMTFMESNSSNDSDLYESRGGGSGGTVGGSSTTAASNKGNLASSTVATGPGPAKDSGQAENRVGSMSLASECGPHPENIDNNKGCVGDGRLNDDGGKSYGELVSSSSHSIQSFTPQFEDISDAEDETSMPEMLKQAVSVPIRSTSNCIPQVKELDTITTATTASQSRLKTLTCSSSSSEFPPSDLSQLSSSLSLSNTCSHSNTLSSGTTNNIQVEMHTPDSSSNSNTSSLRRNSGNNSSEPSTLSSVVPPPGPVAGKWELRSSPRTDDHLAGLSGKSDGSRASSPTRSEKDRFMLKSDKEFRSLSSSSSSSSSSLKVPPLRIIIPPKQTSSIDSDLKMLLTKPALPYVLNPTRENNLEEPINESHTASQTSSRASSPASSRPSSAASDHAAPATSSASMTAANLSTCSAADKALPATANLTGPGGNPTSSAGTLSAVNNTATSVTADANGSGSSSSSSSKPTTTSATTTTTTTTTSSTSTSSSTTSSCDKPANQTTSAVQSSSRDGDSQVGKEKEEPSKSKEKDDVKEEKEEKTTQRITRCLRSHTAQMQQQQQQKKEQHSDKDKQGSSESQPQVNELSGVKGQKSGTTASTGLGSTPATTSAAVEETDEFSIHPRKRKLRPKPDQAQTSEAVTSHPIVLEKPPNPYKTYLSIRKQVRKKVEDRRKNNAVVHPKAPQGFKDYLMMSCSYVLQGNSASTLSVPMLSPPNSVTGPMRELFLDQEQARYKLRLQHLIEKEKLMLSIEQEMLREHARAARAQNNQSIPLSVCTILRDEEIYNLIEAEQVEEREKNVRSRYNGRQFISWIQDVGDKYDKIKELLLLRHHHEAESLFAVQKMDWEWKMKEVSDVNNIPVIDDLHVPMVQVNDDFDLLPS